MCIAVVDWCAQILLLAVEHCCICMLVGKIETTNDNDRMLVRMREATPSNDGRYHCLHEMCTKSYENKYNLILHHKITHLGVRFFCSKCRRPFKKKAAMRFHEKKCTGIKTMLHIPQQLPYISSGTNYFVQNTSN